MELLLKKSYRENMTQDDREIKTISQKTVSRNFQVREIEKMSHIPNDEPQEQPVATRREVMRNLFPTVAQGTGKLLRSFSIKLNETLEKIEKL